RLSGKRPAAWPRSTRPRYHRSPHPRGVTGLVPAPGARHRRPLMEFSGTVDIPASRDRVFAFVTNPYKVAQCGPGTEQIEVVDPTHFKITAKVGVGFISAKFVVNLEIT